MKKTKHIFIILCLLMASQQFAQVIISPYIVYMDEQNKFGSMIVQNESFESYEISISFIFGYPISDSLGNRTMTYSEKPTAEMPSLNDWVKAFPKKFVIKPKERQTIRLMVKPPLGLAPGTYWTRIVTSSTPVDTMIDTSGTGVSAKLKFVINQVTTAIYRKGEAKTDLEIGLPKLFQDSTNTYQLLYPIERRENSPFFGFFNLRIFNDNDELIKEERDYLSVYFDLTRNYLLTKELFIPGKYKAELEIEFNEKEDIPESKLAVKPNIINKFEFEIP